MTVACPQCGAPQEALTETRFYRCPFCSSSFTVQEGTGLLEHCFAHQRDDRLAWSVLEGALEAGGDPVAAERTGCDFRQVPCWLFSFANGTRRLVPAVRHPWGTLPPLALPGGDLSFVPAEAGFPPPEVSLAEAAPAGGEPPARQSLVYLPLYFLDYSWAGTPGRAVVCGVDRKPYFLDGTPVRRRPTVPLGHAALVGGFAVLLIAEALLIRRLPLRAAAFAATCAGSYLLLRLVLLREA